MKIARTSEVSLVPQLALRLRALVLALGESVLPSWWTTRFMSKAGIRFLARLYPRTSLQAAIHAAGRAACDAHDRAVGRVGVYHLFRLPESLESETAQVPPDFDNDFVVGFRAALGNPDTLLALPAELCEGHLGADAASGARRIGADTDSVTSAGLRKAAAIYHYAFAQGKPAFPYFTAGDRK